MPKVSEVWERVAASRGWRYSAALGGYIHSDYMTGEEYDVAADAETACFIDGIETLNAARQSACERLA